MLDYIDYTNNGMIGEAMGCIKPKYSKLYSGVISIFGDFLAILSGILPIVASEGEQLEFLPAKTTYGHNGKTAIVSGITVKYSNDGKVLEKSKHFKQLVYYRGVIGR